MYRAMTWFIQDLGVDVNDAQTVAESAKAEVIQPSIDPSEPGIRVAGRDVSLEIRGPEVTQGVSAVSAVPEVRSLMVNLQREIASNSKTGIVVEGRDICAVVLPEAPVRLFITADPEARANRRAKENGAAAIFMIALDDDRVEKTSKFYARAGYKPLERTFAKGAGSWL